MDCGKAMMSWLRSCCVDAGEQVTTIMKVLCAKVLSAN
jgi:hypothetical protein